MLSDAAIWVPNGLFGKSATDRELLGILVACSRGMLVHPRWQCPCLHWCCYSIGQPPCQWACFVGRAVGEIGPLPTNHVGFYFFLYDFLKLLFEGFWLFSPDTFPSFYENAKKKMSNM